MLGNREANVPFLGSGVDQDNYHFQVGSGSFGNWIALGAPQLNADDTADIFLTTPAPVTIDYFCGLARGCPVPTNVFNFTSIGLASATNDGTGGQILLGFTHQDESFDSSIVSLAAGITGLQTFSFNEQNLTSVILLAINTEGNVF